MTPQSRQDALNQLLDSALRVSTIAQSPIAREFYSATHAAMHIGMCALTSGIVLCGLLLDNPLFEHKEDALIGVQRIIDLFMHFSERNYQLAVQGSRVLSILKRRAMVRIGALPDDVTQEFLGTQTSTVDNFLSALQHERDIMDPTFLGSENDQFLLDGTELFTETTMDQFGAAWLWTDPWHSEDLKF